LLACVAGYDHRVTPLMDAAQAGALPVVQLLVARGAKLDATDVDGNTVL
jgi:ankyrin repeat protein